MKETFLFISEQPDFAAALVEALQAAGKTVVRADSITAALGILGHGSMDSLLVDPALDQDPSIGRLAAAAKVVDADFWILDAARDRQMSGELAAGG